MLTGGLWLTAHDSLKGTPRIRGWPLGIGLATGLLAELGHGGFLDIRQGELFRVGGGPPDDPALRSLLAEIEEEDRVWAPPSPSPRRLAQIRARRPMERVSPPPPAQDGQVFPQPVPEKDPHRRRGHDLRTWMSYLAYRGRAEARVVDRLNQAGLVKREQRRRLFGATTAAYAPYDSAIAGLPAAIINDAVRCGQVLSWSGLFLVGLFHATGLHIHAHAALTRAERSGLAKRLEDLDSMSRELLQAADGAVSREATRPHL